jgi:hypothetical protein
MNLFMLSAPYQLHNAMEAIHYFRLEDNHLRIIDTGHFTHSQFLNVINRDIWQSIRFHDFCYKLVHYDFGSNSPRNAWEWLLERYLVFNQILKKFRAYCIIREMGPLNYLVLGNYQRNYDGHMRHFSNRLHFRELLLLDVGTDTLRINSDRQARYNGSNSLDEIASNRTFISLIKGKLRKDLVDWDVRDVERLTFFTAYDIVPSGDDLVVANQYQLTKSVLAQKTPSAKVFFVGQPLVDQSYITLKTFSSSMEYVRSCFSGQRLVYIPHPRESEIQLGVVRQLGIEIQRFSTPFEYAISFHEERPQCIASFFSSVVENSAAIFGNTVDIKVFRLPVSSLLKDQASVSQLYALYESNEKASIKIIEIPIEGASV